jgi:signal transduction histidine kinase
VIWARIRQALELYPVALPPLDLPEEEAFRRHAAAVTARNLKLVALLAMVSSAFAMVSDQLIYRGAPDVADALAWMRAYQAVASAAMYLIIRLGTRPWRISLAASIFSIVCAWSVGYTTGTLGDLGKPWFHFSYMIFICLFVPVVPLSVRALYGIEALVSLLAGLIQVRPESPAHPMFGPTIAFLAFVVTLSALVGHLIYRLIHQEVASRRARDVAVRETESINRTLQDRVRDQTQDLRLLAAHLESTREDERTRIARELHDELGQELTAMRYTLDFTRQRFDQDPTSVRQNLVELESLLARTAATTRHLISDLRPRILDDLGLEAAVQWLLDRTRERTGLTCTLEDRGGTQGLDAQTSVAAFRILQESLTNVAKHAQASRVELSLGVTEERLEIVVQDDGMGLPPPPSRRRPSPGKGGMGLIGMRERADALGGTFAIESNPGVGTTVRVSLPVSSQGTEAEVLA